ncbi:helicase SNF2 family protein [Dictyobacter sp. S3.2.2.5]|uniref:Helicase SNF2 family protein n=2 Tax=Dictyobacter halimunensis TaxID=3026934 RepID=A0ABQ6G3Y9_9CHLR|nr:helicase SNF2 family protein [Dictyobacter sp. S3.2.2.5]
MLHEVQVDYLDNWSYPDSDTVIWELESVKRVLDRLAIPRVDEFPPDDPKLLQAFLSAYQWSAVNRLAASSNDEANKNELRLISSWQSAVQVEDYQLYPVIKSLLMPRISLLLADDVGLGKTIETGLILSELFARRRIRRALIICPASLQLQWRDEMREKFYLDFTIVDRDETFKLQRELGVDSNPWASYPRIITSMDYLRQGDVLASFKAATENLVRNFDALLPWQMLVVDEVHNLSPARFGDDSDRSSMLRQLSPYFEHRIFLSATPHNGYTSSFTGLLELLDPVRFQQRPYLDDADRPQIQTVMVRRLKRDFDEMGETDRFSHRTVQRLGIQLYPQEQALFAALREYRNALSSVLRARSPRERHLGSFLIKLLTKRLLSGSYAFARTWWSHVEGLEDIAESQDEAVTATAVSRAETVMTDDEERGLREEDATRQTGAWLRRYASYLTQERRAVSECLESLGWSSQVIQNLIRDEKSLREIALPADARWESLWSWIQSYLMQDSHLRKDERLIIFTEYKHSLDYLMERLRREGLWDGVEDSNSPVACLYGGAGSQLRERVKGAFNTEEHPLRILVGTDAVSEGISLQRHCRYVIHQEIPWNPMRLEQRNGRVDRHGQERDVFVFHFGSDDEDDLKFMQSVVAKVDTARDDLGSVGQVIDATVEEYFTQGLSQASEVLNERVNDTLAVAQDRKDMQSRDYGGREDYEQAMNKLYQTEMEMHLSPENVAQVLAWVVEREGGDLKPVPGDEKAYRLTVPKSWKKLVDETIMQEEGHVHRLPKLVFDPSYFEVTEHSRRIFKPRKDAVLIRLGHPLMHRALGSLRRHLWDDKGVYRWTVQGAELPVGLNEALILHMQIEITNEFREVVHQEIVPVGFTVRGSHLISMDNNLRQQIQSCSHHPFSDTTFDQQIDHVREHWDDHLTILRSLIQTMRTQYQQDFTVRMQTRLKEERQREEKRFASRLRELERLQQTQHIETLKREWNVSISEKVRLEQENQQLSFLPEVEITRQQELITQNHKIKALEFDMEQALQHFKQLQYAITLEKERVITKMLPKRYTLATVDVQPLTIEYLVRSTGKEQ